MDIQSIYSGFLKCKGVSTDTRKISQDSIFFALKGANFNGNKFAENALELGAKYAIVDEKEYQTSPNIILVHDVLATLQNLANHHRKQFNFPIIGITGSNGKTTTKELLGEVLKTKFNPCITSGNLNNHIGVPLTLLQLTNDNDIAIIEMGANKPGDIKELVDIAEPTHGLITNIGTSHIEGFGSFEGIIKTKTELYDFISKSRGEIFVNSDDEILSKKVPENVVVHTYGEQSGATIGSITELNPFVSFKWKNKESKSGIIKSKLVGKYNLLNFLAAISVGLQFDIDPKKINKALENYQPTNNRSQVIDTEKNTIIADCYNANPASMAVAIENIKGITASSKILFLGDMLELGNVSIEEHQKLIDKINDFDEVYLVGKEFKKVNSKFPSFETVEELISNIKLENISNSFILLKGSRGIELEKLIKLL